MARMSTLCHRSLLFASYIIYGNALAHLHAAAQLPACDKRPPDSPPALDDRPHPGRPHSPRSVIDGGECADEAIYMGRWHIPLLSASPSDR